MARYVLAAVLFCQFLCFQCFLSNFFGVFHPKLEILGMPSVEGEENGEEEVERSPNEDENMSEDEDEESSLSSDESSSESSSQCFQLFSALFFSSHNFVRLPVSFSMVLMIPFYLVDETENERRRNECLNDMADLERQFSDLKEQLV